MSVRRHHRLALLGICSLVFFLTDVGHLLGAAGDVLEAKTFPVQPGHTLIVQNDYGRVKVRTWDKTLVSAQIRKIAPDDSHLNNIIVVSRTSGTKIYLHAYFYDYSAESVYIDLQVPKQLNVFISGANPAVELYALAGHTRVSTLTGLITAQDLTSSASLLTDSGDITYSTGIQPVGDIRLESIRGNIVCNLNDKLSLRGWTRAGGRLFWDQGIELNNGFLEKQIGLGGPLLYASSLKGDVRVQFEAGAGERSAQKKPAFPKSTSSAPDRTPSRRSETSSAGPALRPVSTVSTSPSETAKATPQNRTSRGAVDPGYRVQVNVDWIYLNVSVRDRYSNRSIAGLQKEDFLVYEDSVLQRVERFEPTEAPFNLLLLLDISGSTRDFLDLMKEASIEFTRQIRPDDRIAVAAFNSQVWLVQTFSNDRQRIAQAISRVRSGGGTAFYDALHACIREYMDGIEGRKAIVIFTDGVDNQLTGDYSNGSRTTFPTLYREIQEIDSIVYTIFLDSEGDPSQIGPGRRGGTLGGILKDIIRGRTPPYSPRRRGGSDRAAYQKARHQLKRIADQTGGRMYSPQRIQDLSYAYSEIADDLRVQYTLGYNSTNLSRKGEWREIKVELRNQGDAVARTRRGYYAGRSDRSSVPPSGEKRSPRSRVSL